MRWRWSLVMCCHLLVWLTLPWCTGLQSYQGSAGLRGSLEEQVSHRQSPPRSNPICWNTWTKLQLMINVITQIVTAIFDKNLMMQNRDHTHAGGPKKSCILSLMDYVAQRSDCANGQTDLLLHCPQMAYWESGFAWQGWLSEWIHPTIKVFICRVKWISFCVTFFVN